MEWMLFCVGWAVFFSVCFSYCMVRLYFLGVEAGRRQEQKGQAPFPQRKANRPPKEKQKSAEEELLAQILKNVETYDGTAAGQKKVI